MARKYIKNNILISNELEELKELVLNYTNNPIFITDNNLYNLYHNELTTIFNNPRFIVVNEGEVSKSLETIGYLTDELIKLGVTREEYLIAFGGGAILDLVGFLAGILYRGINVIYIPTSLLAMVDASVGGKTAINFGSYKNILGLFREPNMIYINSVFLKTLPYDEYICGMGEVIKYKMLDKDFDLNLDINEIIINSILLKNKYVEEDFYDKGMRMMLNLGHTFGHHLELKYNISHGLAVLNGINLILKLEKDLKLINDEIISYYLNIINNYNIKLLDIDYKEYLDLIFIDKKNIKNTLNLIFIDNNLNPFIYKTTKEDLYAKLKNK